MSPHSTWSIIWKKEMYICTPWNFTHNTFKHEPLLVFYFYTWKQHYQQNPTFFLYFLLLLLRANKIYLGAKKHAGNFTLHIYLIHLNHNWHYGKNWSHGVMPAAESRRKSPFPRRNPGCRKSTTAPSRREVSRNKPKTNRLAMSTL